MTLRIAITPGEPAGIGPDLLIQLAQLKQSQELIVVADPELLLHRAKILKLPLTIRSFDSKLPAQISQQGELCVAPCQLNSPCQAGELNSKNAPYVLETLDTAIELCLNNIAQAFVTAPVHKGVINDAGISFSGHTEYLAEKTKVKKVVMMLATKGLRVALVTTHIPLREVSEQITHNNLVETIQILATSLKEDFAIPSPRIVVCGLNPHAGEGGHLGREEIDIIEPALATLRKQGFSLLGPLPADTVFTPKVLDHADAVLAMYHDQGLPTLKYKGFGKAVNITLGLPIIRTSVDHGTALDLAGKGTADLGSLQVALQTAIEMAESE